MIIGFAGVISACNQLGVSVIFSVTHVVSEQAQEPLRNVDVSLYQQNNSEPVASLKTTDAGGGMFEELDKASYILRVHNPNGYQRVVVQAPLNSFEEMGSQIDQAVSGSTLDIPIKRTEWEILNHPATIREIMYYTD